MLAILIYCMLGWWFWQRKGASISIKESKHWNWSLIFFIQVIFSFLSLLREDRNSQIKRWTPFENLLSYNNYKYIRYSSAFHRKEQQKHIRTITNKTKTHGAAIPSAPLFPYYQNKLPSATLSHWTVKLQLYNHIKEESKNLLIKKCNDKYYAPWCKNRQFKAQIWKSF